MVELSEDLVAEGYDRIADHIYEERSAYSDTLKLAPDCRGAVLDVGCGQGRLLELVAHRFPDVTRLAGCDLSPRLCEMARKRVPHAAVSRDSAVGLEKYSDDEFDFVFMVSTLEHVLDHESALQSVHRVLRPGGALIVATTNRRWILYERWRRNHVQVEPVDSYWFEPEELFALLESAGFEIRRVRGVWALLRGDWRHAFENALASIYPPLHRKMKLIGVRCRKPVSLPG